MSTGQIKRLNSWEESNHDLPNNGQALHPLSYEKLIGSKVLY